MPFLSHVDWPKVRDALIAGREFFGGADTAQLDEAITLMRNADEAVASPALAEAARDLHGCDEIEIDDEGAGTSPTDEGGTWVQAWVWVPQDEEDDDD